MKNNDAEQVIGLQKFAMSDAKQAKAYYDQNGYVIFAKLLPETEIDRFLGNYSQLKGNRLFIYPTQSTHRPMQFVPDEHGHIVESMGDPAFMALVPKFSKSAMDCVTNSGLASALSAIDGEEKHTLWQTMFFDKATGTLEHQDSWYLDSQPRGKLIGSWLALEDITDESGPFFVYPGSHLIAPITQDEADHEAFINKVRDILASQTLEKRMLPVQRGDVIFWHPSTIHGSEWNSKPSQSRKSLTAHFYPEGMDTIKGPAPRITRITKDISRERKNLFAYHLRQYIRLGYRLLRGGNPVTFDMRRAEGG